MYFVQRPLQQSLQDARIALVDIVRPNSEAGQKVNELLLRRQGERLSCSGHIRIGRAYVQW